MSTVFFNLRIDEELNEELIKNPASIFLGKVVGDCVKGEQVHEGGYCYY